MNDPSVVLYFEHVLCPQNRKIKTVVGLTLMELDPKWSRPYIAIADGKPISRQDWGKRIFYAHIVFVDVHALPQGGGGGGSDPLRMVAMIAVMVVAYAFGQYYAGPALSGMFGGSAAVWGAAASSVVMVVGSALVNAVLPAASVATSSNNNSITASPTYNLQAQGNTARLDAAVPEHFGRVLAYPDFAAQPYQEFAGNDQFLYQLLCIGRGEYSIEAIRISDTPISSFEEVTYEVINPGETLDLFPANVVTSDEVASQEMTQSTYIGPFVASAPETVSNYIGVDFVFPRGLYYAEDDGNLSQVTVTAIIDIQQINDLGVAIGPWVTVGSVSYTMATATPQRVSERYAVAPGRYQVRVMRTNAKQTDTRYGHEIDWGGLRAYLTDTRTFGDCTLLAIRMRASSQLSSTSARKINVIATRKLPTWNGSAWTGNVATTSIAWAAAYIAKAANLKDSQIDLATLLQLDAVWSSRGDTFNYRFDNFVSFWEALGTVLMAGRAKPFMQAGVLRFFRDQAASLPVALFNMRNIVKQSFSVQYVMPTEETADAVQVSYFDDIPWATRKVQAKLAVSTAAKPAKIELAGVTNRDQAFREGMYQAACNRYRRKIIKFSTEMDGFIPSFGDLIAIQHDVPAWGQGGDVAAIDWNVLTLSEDLEWQDGSSHYIAFHYPNGQVYGPFPCIPGVQANQVVVSGGLDPDMLSSGDGTERTRYAFGWAETIYQKARVLTITPKSLYTVDIEAVNEDPNVHTAETGVLTPVAPTSQLAGYTSAPVVTGLLVRSSPADANTMVLSWNAAPWADHYVVELSADEISWVRVGEPGAASFTTRALYGNRTIARVAAVGMTRGPWAIVYYSGSSDFMWTIDSALFWSGNDSTLMWG